MLFRSMTTATAVAALRGQYAGRIEFHEVVPPMDPTRLPRARSFKRNLQRNRIAAFCALPMKSIEALALPQKLKEIGQLEGASKGGAA